MASKKTYIAKHEIIYRDELEGQKVIAPGSVLTAAQVKAIGEKDLKNLVKGRAVTEKEVTEDEATDEAEKAEKTAGSGPRVTR